MKNVTITLDEETAGRVRVEAAQKEMSVSRYVGEVLREHMRKRDDYQRAMQRFLALKPVKLKGPGEKYPKREELYDRPVFRRR